MSGRFLALPVALLWITSLASFHNYAEESASELAKETQNPVSSLISVPFQNNTDFKYGPTKGNRNTLNIQPVVPVDISDNWTMITRTILPVISTPKQNENDFRHTGLGDATVTAFFSPKSVSTDFIWGVGPVFLLPTASEKELGYRKWGAGPSFVGLTMQGPWVIGSLLSNVWSEGKNKADRVNLFTWQYFINYNMEGGTYINTAPIITANWNADRSKDRWTIPFGAGIGKVFIVNKQPVNALISAYYNVEKPQYGPDWQLRLQFQFLFPK